VRYVIPVRLILAILAVVAGAVVEAALATAAPPKPIAPTSGVSQYVEELPASDGPRFTSRWAAARAGTGSAAALPAATRRAVQAQGGPQAHTLLEVASDPAFASPAEPVAVKPTAGRGATGKRGGSTPGTRVVAGSNAHVGAAGAAAGGLGGSALLLAALAAVSLLVVGATFLRGGSQPSP